MPLIRLEMVINSFSPQSIPSRQSLSHCSNTVGKGLKWITGKEDGHYRWSIPYLNASKGKCFGLERFGFCNVRTQEQFCEDGVLD